MSSTFLYFIYPLLAAAGQDVQIRRGARLFGGVGEEETRIAVSLQRAKLQKPRKYYLHEFLGQSGPWPTKGNGLSKPMPLFQSLETHGIEDSNTRRVRSTSLL